MSPAVGGGRTGRGENALYRKSPPKWCDYCPDAHDGPHVRFIGELMLARNATATSIALTLESASAYEPHPVIWIGVRVGAPVPIHLSWEHAAVVAAMLTEAKGRYA